MSATVYRMYDAHGALLYVGCSVLWPTRVGQHSEEKPWWSEVASLTVEHHDTRDAALAAESAAIRVERPAYNKQLGRGERRPLFTGRSPLVALRLNAGLTRGELARRAGVTGDVIRRLEAGAPVVHLRARAVAAVLGVKVTDLMPLDPTEAAA